MKCYKRNINVLAAVWNNNITATTTSNQAFARYKINGIINQTKAIKNISNCSYREKGKELIVEAYADYYANGSKETILSKEIIKVMKGMI